MVRRFDAGVTSIQSHPYCENIIAVGSYDSRVRIIDVRKFNRPMVEVDVGGCMIVGEEVIVGGVGAEGRAVLDALAEEDSDAGRRLVNLRCILGRTGEAGTAVAGETGAATVGVGGAGSETRLLEGS